MRFFSFKEIVKIAKRWMLRSQTHLPPATEGFYKEKIDNLFPLPRKHLLNPRMSGTMFPAFLKFGYQF